MMARIAGQKMAAPSCLSLWGTGSVSRGYSYYSSTPDKYTNVNLI